MGGWNAPNASNSERVRQAAAAAGVAAALLGSDRRAGDSQARLNSVVAALIRHTRAGKRVKLASGRAFKSRSVRCRLNPSSTACSSETMLPCVAARSILPAAPAASKLWFFRTTLANPSRYLINHVLSLLEASSRCNETAGGGRSTRNEFKPQREVRTGIRAPFQSIILDESNRESRSAVRMAATEVAAPAPTLGDPWRGPALHHLGRLEDGGVSAAFIWPRSSLCCAGAGCWL